MTTHAGAKEYHVKQGLTRLLSARERTPTRPRALDSEIFLGAPIDRVFTFFANPTNLERITPPWLNFEILASDPIVMRVGAEIDYRIRLYGLPMPWRSRIDVWAPGFCFVDTQTVGPYRWWRHEHVFDSVPGGTRVFDRVEYVPRGGWLTDAMVRRDLERIFAYRRDALRQIFHATTTPCATLT